MASGCNRRNRIMSNPIKDAFDKASLIKNIDERDSIISDYQRYGLLDRDDAIKKIIYHDDVFDSFPFSCLYTSLCIWI